MTDFLKANWIYIILILAIIVAIVERIYSHKKINRLITWEKESSFHLLWNQMIAKQELYKTLTLDFLNNLSDIDLIEAIQYNVLKNNEKKNIPEKELYSKFPHTKSLVLTILDIRTELLTDGFMRYYENFNGDDQDVIDMFKEIGATHTANLFKRAGKMYRSFRPHMLNFDKAMLKSFDDEFRWLDRQEKIKDLCVKYIRINIKDFVSV